MNIMLSRAGMIAAGLCLLCAHAKADKVYATSNEWFKVVAKDAAVPAENGAASNGKWTAVPSGDDKSCTKANDKFVLDTDYSTPLTYQATSEGDTFARFSANIVLTACDDLPSLISAKTALCVLYANNAFTWQACSGLRDDNPVWTPLGAVLETDLDANYEIVLETDLSTGKFRYFVKKEGVDAYTELKPDGAQNGWLTYVSAPTVQIQNVSFYGSTTLGDFGATVVRTATVADTFDPDTVDVVVIGGAKAGASVFVEKSWKTAKGLAADADMNATASNGLTYLQSYVLGLDPATATAKPVANVVQNSKGDKVSFKLDGVTVKTDAGARVTYRVKTYANPDATGAYVDSDVANYNEEIEVALPTGNTKVQYYKVEVCID